MYYNFHFLTPLKAHLLTDQEELKHLPISSRLIRNIHEILLTSIPRDYYVQVHGKSGLKDKLTHAGIYGLDTSRKTLEDLFDINPNESINLYKSLGYPGLE